MKRKNVVRHEVFKLESGTTLMLEKEYDVTGKVLLYAGLKLIDYDHVTTIASGDSEEDFAKELDSYIGLFQALRQEFLGAQQNPF